MCFNATVFCCNLTKDILGDMSGKESEALKRSTTDVEAEPQAVERVGEQGVIHQGKQFL
jgi:hypothetical protein